MKKLVFFLVMFMASIVTQAQTSYGGPVGNSAGQNGSSTCSYFGTAAGLVNKGDNNTFLGNLAGRSNDDGSQNVFVGAFAGQAHTTGNNNVFAGFHAGYHDLSGYRNIFIGGQSGFHKQEGGDNIFIGQRTAYYNRTGERNTILGSYAGENATGDDNVFIGFRAGRNEIENNRLYIDNSDTDTPLIYGDFSANDLTLNAGVSIVAPDGNTELELKSTNNNGGWHNQIRFHDNTNLRHVIADNFTDGRLVIAPGFGGNAANMVQVNGSLLVGNGALLNTPPGYDLYVTEGILTEKLKVAAYGSIDWADYVFEDNYELNSPEEVEQFVKEHKHLPNVPSAKEVNENGVDMVEMDATLLRQIEELWLHVIDLKKENEALKTEVAELKK